MGKQPIIELVKNSEGIYEASGEVHEDPKESPKKERTQRKYKEPKQPKQPLNEMPYQGMATVPDSPVGSVLHGISTGLFVIREVSKAVNKIMK